MNSSECDLLEDFLARDLTPEREQSFRIHLVECQACDSAVKQQERMDALLTKAVTQLVPVPAELASRVRSRLRRAQRRRYLAYSVSAAAAAAVAWILFQTIDWPRIPPKAAIPPPRELVAEKAKAAPAPVRISFPNESKLIVIPEATDSPDVSFVWVYPNQRSEHRKVVNESRSLP